MSKLIIGENDLKTLMPELMEDWDWDLNEKDPSTLMLGSNYYAHWKCHVCGHRWVSRLDSRTKCLHGCPVCAKNGGSSIPDRLLYLLISQGVEDEEDVFYRYNIFPSCEVDVYIQSKKIAIEYNGYSFHSTESKRSKDIYKKQLLVNNGITLISLNEINDRFALVSFNGNDVSMPEFTVEYFDTLKANLLLIANHYSLIQGVSEEYESITLEEMRSQTRKPLYNRSLKYMLDQRSDIFWDYEKNTVNPEDVYGSIRDYFYFNCQYGHGFKSTPSMIREGYGCQYCSHHRDKEFPYFNKYYNLSLIFPEDIKSLGYSSIESIIMSSQKFICPFCGKEKIRRIDNIIYNTERGKSNKDQIAEYCSCTEVISDPLNVYFLGMCKDSRLFYAVKVKDVYFLAIQEQGISDFILSTDNIFSLMDSGKELNISLFKKYIGDPYIMSTTANSSNTIPITKLTKPEVSLIYSFNEEDIYKKLRDQVEKGVQYDYNSSPVIKLSKKLVIDWIQKKLDSGYNSHFAVNQTIWGYNTDLVCRSKGLALMVKLNLCNTKYKDALEQSLIKAEETGCYHPLVITSYKDLAWSSNVVIIPMSVEQNKLEDVLQDMYNKVCEKFESIV